MSTQGRVTVGVLLDSLGPEVLTALALPDGRETLVGSPVIYDPEDSMADLTGSVLLVAGRPQPALLDQAARSGITVVVVKAGSIDPVPLIEAARASGTALLAADAEMSWGQMYGLIGALLAVVAPAADPTGPHAADLFTLANQVALRVGGAVAIEDLAMRVLAYSTIEGHPIDELRMKGILGRRVPDHPTHPDEYAMVMRSPTAVWSYEPREFYPRLAIAIGGPGETLGTIWALQAEQPLHPDAAEVLAEAAQAAAPHLAQLNVTADQARRHRDEELTWLLRGIGNLDQLAISFGLRPDEPVTVVAVGPRSQPPDAFAARHIGDLLRTAYTAYRIRAAAGAVDARVYAVVACDDHSALLHKITTDALTQLTDRLGGAWRAGIGRTAPSVLGVPTCLRQAEEALRALCGPFTEQQVGRHEDLAAAVFLLELNASVRARPSLPREPLSIIAQQDENHGTDYLHTLRTWMSTHYSVPEAAEIMSLHPNTLRYRLHRISELIDLDDPDTRLVLALQLRLNSAEQTAALQTDAAELRRVRQ